jgi:hypothetical protein
VYSQTSIQLLIDRIGWSNPIQPNSVITLSPENGESVSGRFFNSFHHLSIVENVYKCIENKDANEAVVNDFLLKMKKDCVLEVLNKIFDTNPLANNKKTEDLVSLNWKTDYNTDIQSKISLFDDAIGYSMAVRCLQLFISSTRSNATERKLGQSYELLKVELEGVVNQEGVLIAKGALGYYDASIINAIKILFPTETKSKKRLYGRIVW